MRGLVDERRANDRPDVGVFDGDRPESGDIDGAGLYLLCVGVVLLAISLAR